MTAPERQSFRILFITQFFDPEPAFKGLGFVKAMVSAGHDVEVITGFPNYPGGVVYPGYKVGWFKTEVIDGITVHRVPLYPSHDRSALGRLLNYATFAASATIKGVLRAGAADVIYVYHPPLTAAMAGALVGLVRRRPVVADIQDLWPDTLRATGMIGSPRILSLIGTLAKLTYRLTTRLVVQSPGFRSRLIARGVPQSKLDLIVNWGDEPHDGSKPPELDLAPYGFDNRFTVLFAGTMGAAQGLDIVLDAAKRVAPRLPHVQFLLVGGGIERTRLATRIAAEKIGNVRLCDPVPRANVGALLDRADALLVTLRPDPLFEITIPSKTQSYLARGKPLLVSAAGDTAALVQSASAGLVVPPGDAAALAEAVVTLAELPDEKREAMGQSGRGYYTTHLSFARGISATLASCASAIAAYRSR